MKWALIIGGVAVAGFFAYKYAKPYLNAVKNVGAVAGSAKGAFSDITSFFDSAAHISSDLSHVSSGVSSLWDDFN